MTDFTKDDLLAAFEELGQNASAAGKIIDLLVYGGSSLMLVSNFRLSSEDVDAVALSDQPFVDKLAHDIAATRGWPADWLNDGVRTYLSPNVDGTEHHELVGTYPNERTPGLRVFVPTPEYLLAMKLMALRIEASLGDKDLQDILKLMQVIGIARKSEIVDFAARFYPEARISGKLHLALDYLWKLYQSQTLIRPDEAPRYLGRAGPDLQS